MIFGLKVYGIGLLQKHINLVSNSIRRMRYVGVPRIGRYLLNSRKTRCKMGLYSGQEVAPNKWRYGWEHLGGPAKNYFTKATLEAHEMINTRHGIIGDVTGVMLNPIKSPHAAMIHGPIDSLSSYFYNERLETYVKTRPWMRVTREDKETCVGVLAGTYGARNMAAIAALQKVSVPEE